jgi:uncharacterized membrane protein
MSKTRLEAFSDGVIAILITIMVLELKVPHGKSWEELHPAVFTLLLYAMSYNYIGIYWSNHHHMLQVVRKIDGRVLWANLYLLFWLSLIPFVIRWIGEAGVTRDTVLAFGFVMLMCSVAYALLKRSLIAAEGPDSRVAEATGKDTKGMVSIVAYVAALLVAFMSPLIAILIYLAIAAMWLIPDRRFEALDGSGR